MNKSIQFLALFLASVCYASIKPVNTIGRTHPRNSNDPPMLVSDIYEVSEYFYGKEMEQPAGMVGITLPDDDVQLTVKRGLTDTCQEKLCDMFYYALSCKALGLGVNKVCASYFLGANFACPQFPSPDDFYNAPSVCIVEYGLLGKMLADGDIFAALGSYLGQTFQETTCGRRCFQNYQYASNDFYQNCYSQLATNTTNQETYKLAYKIMNFQEFRNQACAYSHNSRNNTDTNCYQQFTTPSTSDLDIFNMECNYYGLTEDSPANLILKNTGTLGVLCAQFSAYGCCMANDVTMYQQAQTNASNIALFPPCLLSYLTNACPTVNLQNYCKNGSIASVATTVAELVITKSINGLMQKFLFPNMYNKTSVNQLQGAISGILQGFFPPGADPPFIFNGHYPFQVQILSYTYMYLNNTPITPVNKLTGKPSGVPFFPPGEDYPKAEKIRVIYSVTVQNTDNLEEAAAYLDTNLNSTDFAFYMSAAYSGYSLIPVGKALLTPTTWFAADPLVLPPNSAVSILSGHSTVALGLVLTVMSSVWLSLFM